MSTGDIFQIGLIAAGGVLIFVGDKIHVPNLLNLGVATIGFGVVAMGAGAVLKRRIEFREKNRAVGVTYRGLAAAAWGLLLALFGVAIMGAAAASVLGMRDALLEVVKAHPGLLVAPLGLVMILRGIAGVIGPDDTRRSIWSALSQAVYRFGGLILLAFGVLTVVLAIWDLRSPGTLRRLVESLASSALALLEQVG
ncbi:MAG: hypothetical protein K8J31_27455 [Anaerolineae bacterium]|nr:hypothetical protein [Anaerolineae bacterium]